MFPELNLSLRRSFPGLHRLLKNTSRNWREAGAWTLPVPKKYHDRIMLAHPQFLTWNLKDLDHAVPRWIAGALKKGNTFFDIGANYGFFTWYGAVRVGRRGHVVAFEPSAANLEVLAYHVKVNHLQQTTIVPKAVSDRRDEGVSFYLLNGGRSASNSLTIDSDDAPRIAGSTRSLSTISTISIDEFVADTNIVPDLIKIDVEGAELLVCRGSEKTLRLHRPIVILAVHPFWLPRGDTTSMIYHIFARNGYTITNNSGHLVKHLDEGDYLCRP